MRVETTVVGQLEPMPWIAFAFRGMLRDGLLADLDRFSWIDHASLSTPELRRAVKAFDGHERIVDEAIEVAGSAVKFFATDNLMLLARWVPERLASRRQVVAEWAQSESCQLLSGGRHD